MNNFEYCVPTRVIFGRDTQKRAGELIKEYGFRKVMIHYGGGSVKRSGLLDQVTASLREAGIETVLFGGVQANPTLSKALEGMEICRREGVDFILAVGGGSVIDSAKCIADGAPNPEIDPWKFFMKEAVPPKALPHGNILTLSASGSETSQSCVITNEENGLKRGFNCPAHRPLFAVCNPELTFTVSRFQTGCGTVDILMHTLERYLGGTTKDTALTDRIAEGLMKAVIEAGTAADLNPEDYEARATLMWAGSLSHNDLTGLGREVMMTVHQLEHELSGKYPEVAHGAGLSALFCSWARYVCRDDPMRFAQLAVRVWDVEMNFENPLKTALDGIQRIEDYFKSLNMPVRLSELEADVKEADFDEMAEKCTNFGRRVLPGIRELGKREMMEIYRMAL
ncbi:iron-containing alcohol dehydrogenase [Hungatella hathewayi]|mgnify:FL=1|uniref:Alcohol dehydrogenase, iron-dependent n=1 Tax=Hungatella hathewayi DSM 13479 TaxID=566550 RepID=D3A910_9FIRM|nr:MULTISPECIES: iron-containing alcohol dehydrogenase [Hungatella]EFD01686.1 alcohol dehydrogenase, iron-dependent [Hungatella hathewayi DSM 13479]MCI6453334.1 iron-containing alcohol dehydrogenase [Hungatella sp.]MDU4973568.1 iron-containing alcohol dehydrogenase [Hungatella hathewayi]UWO84275.1 iron-containing alcohol dehydrogenase [Hungatella hathewayi]